MDPITKASFSPLPYAVSIGDNSTVLFLLELGNDPEQEDDAGKSLLHLAVENQQYKCLTYLLEHGAKADRVDKSGISPIEAAIKAGYTDAINLLTGKPVIAQTPKAAAPNKNITKTVSVGPNKSIKIRSKFAVVQTILLYIIGVGIAFGAYEMKLTFRDRSSQAVLDAIAVNSETKVSKLLTQGIDANVKDSSGKSALMFAANTGRTPIVRLLLKNHADPNLGVPEGISTLHRAGMEHTDIIEALLDNHADPNKTDSRGKTLLSYASATRKHNDLVNLLLKYKAKPNVTGENGPPLVSYIEADTVVGSDTSDIATVAALLNSGADPNARDSGGTPVLTWAAEQSGTELFNLLLKAGALVNQTDTTHRTALQAACRQERTDIVEILLNHSANTNAKDAEGNTAAMYALSGVVDGPDGAADRCRQIIAMLRQHGANLEMANSAGVTPAKFASDHNITL